MSYECFFFKCILMINLNKLKKKKEKNNWFLCVVIFIVDMENYVCYR